MHLGFLQASSPFTVQIPEFGPNAAFYIWRGWQCHARGPWRLLRVVVYESQKGGNDWKRVEMRREYMLMIPRIQLLALLWMIFYHPMVMLKTLSGHECSLVIESGLIPWRNPTSNSITRANHRDNCHRRTYIVCVWQVAPKSNFFCMPPERANVIAMWTSS